MARTGLVLMLAAVVAAGCGGDGSPGAGGDAPGPDAGTPDDAPVPPVDGGPDGGPDAGPVDYPYSDLDVGCAPIFAQSIVPEYHLTIAPDVWATMEHEFLNPQLSPNGTLVEPPYHPAQLHLVAGTAEHEPPGVMIRLNGNTSWLQTIALDENPKMQFMIAFNKVDPDARFQRLRKVKLDMPRSDWTFLQQRVGLAWLRGRAGVPGQCANSARVYINGAYYGLYTNIESQDKSFLDRVYGDADDNGDLWKAGREIKTNEETFTWARITAWWNVTDLAGLDAWTDLDDSMVEWASEAVIGDSDGYNQGRPNFLLYDRPSTQQFVWLANDLDTVLDADFLPPETTPVFAPSPPGEGRWERDWYHYLIALNDPAGVQRYVQAMSLQLPRLDPAELERWIDDWGAQIADAASADPRRPFSLADHAEQLVRMKAYSSARAAYLQGWLDCWNGGGADADGDAFDLCHDCNDHDATQSPAAVEVCDEIDNDCDGRVDNVGAETACALAPEADARDALWRRIHVDVKAEARAAERLPR